MREQDLIALAIPLEGAAMAVGIPAVHLDNETVVRPVRVEQKAMPPEVSLGTGQLCLGDQLEQCPLATRTG
jgi:hypothetical protein